MPIRLARTVLDRVGDDPPLPRSVALLRDACRQRGPKRVAPRPRPEYRGRRRGPHGVVRPVAEVPPPPRARLLNPARLRRHERPRDRARPDGPSLPGRDVDGAYLIALGGGAAQGADVRDEHKRVAHVELHRRNTRPGLIPLSRPTRSDARRPERPAREARGQGRRGAALTAAPSSGGTAKPRRWQTAGAAPHPRPSDLTSPGTRPTLLAW